MLTCVCTCVYYISLYVLHHPEIKKNDVYLKKISHNKFVVKFYEMSLAATFDQHIKSKSDVFLKIIACAAQQVFLNYICTIGQAGCH